MPAHEFLLLPEKDNDYFGYTNHFNDPNALKLNDDIILYMMDTLRWVPSINPANPNQWGGYGLNYYGPTVINKAGAGKAAGKDALLTLENARDWVILRFDSKTNAVVAGNLISHPKL